MESCGHFLTQKKIIPFTVGLDVKVRSRDTNNGQYLKFSFNVDAIHAMTRIGTRAT